MGNKYTVTAGISSMSHYCYGTEWLLVALWKLYTIKIDNKKIYWKQLQII